MLETSSVELLAWIPKSVLLGAVIALLYAGWWIVKYIVKSTHKEVMTKISTLGDNIKEIKELVHNLNGQWLDQHKETKHEIKEYVFEIKDKFESEIKSIKRRIELIESR